MILNVDLKNYFYLYLNEFDSIGKNFRPPKNNVKLLYIDLLQFFVKYFDFLTLTVFKYK